MPKNLMNKTRTPEDPYLTVFDATNVYGPTTFKVLKSYQFDADKKWARALVVAVSDFTGPSGDWGDAYWGDITGEITQRDPIVTDEQLPSHLKGGAKVATGLDEAMTFLFGGDPADEPDIHRRIE